MRSLPENVDLVSQANASELVYTLPGLGGALDTSAQKEDRSIQNSLPKLEAEIDGQANIPDPQPAKITLGEPKTIGAPSEPNQAKKRPMISTAMHPIKPSNNLMN